VSPEIPCKDCLGFAFEDREPLYLRFHTLYLVVIALNYFLLGLPDTRLSLQEQYVSKDAEECSNVDVGSTPESELYLLALVSYRCLD